MSAPENIVAWVWKLPFPSDANGRAEWNAAMYPSDQDCTSFTRTDLSQASVAAALEAAACEADATKDYIRGAYEIAEAIRALITPDQRTALQAAIDAAVAEARAEDATNIEAMAAICDAMGDRQSAIALRSAITACYQIGAKP